MKPTNLQVKVGWLVDQRTPQYSVKAEGEAEEEEKKERLFTMGCDCDCECRPLGWLLGLPFAFLSLFISIAGVVIWIVGLLLSCICPCCLCVTVMVELAIELVKAPIHVMKWFTSQIPC